MSEFEEENNKRRMSLIDVSFEDDCLYHFPPPGDQMVHKSVDNFGFVEAGNVEGTLERKEEEEESGPNEPLGGTGGNVKYNLRKSLAWDSAFFTSAGVLEPEELTSMIGGAQKGEKFMLPGIEEDVHRSTDSMSTLASDNLTVENLEADLFSDIRASIQKSSKASNEMKSSGKLAIGVRESQTSQSLEQEDIASRNKFKIKSAPKKPNVVVQGSGKITKQVSVGSQASQCNASIGDSTSTLRKPPKIGGKVSPMPTTATKRASLGANRVKVEKDNATISLGNLDNAKSSTGRGVKVSTLGSSRNALPRPKLSSKSSLGSNKKELATPSSSFDSSGSFSSDSSSKGSSNSVGRKIDSRTGNHSSSGSTMKPTLKIASRTRNQSMSSHLSPCLKSVTRLSCSISPASSISEWSSASLSPTSTLNKRSISSRPSLDTSSCNDSSEGCNAPQDLASQTHSNERSSDGHSNQVPRLPHERAKRVSTGSSALQHPDSIKPSGLRMPSPKIGFFDGVKSAVRTPTGSMQSHSARPGGLPRSGTRNVSSSGGSNEAKLGKLQTARSVMAVCGTKIAQQPALGKARSPLPLQESSNSAPKASSVSRKEKCSPAISLKVQNIMNPENGGESNLKAEKVAYQECGIEINNPDFGFAEMDGSLSLLKDKTSQDCNVISPVTATEIASTNNEPIALYKSSVIQELNLSWKRCEDDQSNVKEKSCNLDQVDRLTKRVGCIDIRREIQKEPIGDYLLCLREVNSCTESGKLSSPVFSLSPTAGSTVLEAEKMATCSHPSQS